MARSSDSSRSLEVRLTWSPERSRKVGRLTQTRRGCFFEYDRDFLDDPLWISPFHLPPERGLTEHRDHEFGPLFGVFDDSLPDGWGRLLMDRLFRRRGISPAEITAVDRLAHLGTRTLGALTYHPPAEPGPDRSRALDLRDMARESERVLSGQAGDLLPELARAGGSPGGARPKVLVGVPEDETDDELLSGEDDLPPGFEHWIVKFQAGADDADAGAVEFAYAEMARWAGLEMPATRLFITATGERYFGARRFDRDHDGRRNRRVHMHTFGNLIHANFRVPSCDYEQLLQATRTLTRNHRDVVECFCRMVFNVAVHNRDDHAKNFSFLMDASGEWRLSPAYDLTYSEGPAGEHSMTVAGEGRRPGWKHAMQLADSAGLKRAEATEAVKRVLAAVERWDEVARDLDVASTVRRRVSESLAECRRALEAP